VLLICEVVEIGSLLAEGLWKGLLVCVGEVRGRLVTLRPVDCS